MATTLLICETLPLALQRQMNLNEEASVPLHQNNHFHYHKEQQQQQQQHQPLCYEKKRPRQLLPRNSEDHDSNDDNTEGIMTMITATATQLHQHHHQKLVHHYKHRQRDELRCPLKKRQKRPIAEEGVKSVRFSPPEGNTVRTRPDVSDEDVKRSWMCDSDYKRIRHDNVSTILAFAKRHHQQKSGAIPSAEEKEQEGRVHDQVGGDVCIRGLEGAIFKFVYKFNNYHNQRKVTKHVVRLYKQMQRRGSSRGGEEEDRRKRAEQLREMSTLLTQHDQCRALEAAKVDAALAKGGVLACP